MSDICELFELVSGVKTVNIKKIYEKYKDVIPYLFFGVCTTLVNLVSYWFFAHILHIQTMPSTVIAWFLAVLFAYITNRKWVFHSTAVGTTEVVKEIISFFSCRVATGIVDWLCMYIFVDILGWNDLIIKFIANVLVIVLNYIASKMIIFKKKKVENTNESENE